MISIQLPSIYEIYLSIYQTSIQFYTLHRAINTIGNQYNEVIIHRFNREQMSDCILSTLLSVIDVFHHLLSYLDQYDILVITATCKTLEKFRYNTRLIDRLATENKVEISLFMRPNILTYFSLLEEQRSKICHGTIEDHTEGWSLCLAVLRRRKDIYCNICKSCMNRDISITISDYRTINKEISDSTNNIVIWIEPSTQTSSGYHVSLRGIYTQLDYGKSLVRKPTDKQIQQFDKVNNQ